jgi:hypothetical protein
MKLLTLTQGQFAIVDDEDFEEMNQYRWYARISGRKGWIAQRGARRDGRWISLNLAREVLYANASTRIIHKNGNGLDCRKENLYEKSIWELIT